MKNRYFPSPVTIGHGIGLGDVDAAMCAFHHMAAIGHPAGGRAGRADQLPDDQHNQYNCGDDQDEAEKIHGSV